MTDHDLLIRIDERVGGIAQTLTDHNTRITDLEIRRPKDGSGFIFRMIDFFAELPAIVHVVITGSMALLGVVAFIIAFVKKH